jgi:hypothetical protein
VLQWLRELRPGSSVSTRRIRQALQEHYDPIPDGGTYWWPADAPRLVLRSIMGLRDASAGIAGDDRPSIVAAYEAACDYALEE